MSMFYYHGTDYYSFINILETGEIKCRRLLSKENININNGKSAFGPGANGNEYISLCNKNINSIHDEYSSFQIFIRGHFCFIICSDIKALPTIYKLDEKMVKLYGNEYRKYCSDIDSSTVRFSIMCDEYQVKTRIPMDKIIGIGFPYLDLKKEEIDYLIGLGYKMNLDVVNTSDPFFIEEYEKEKCKNIVLSKLCKKL